MIWGVKKAKLTKLRLDTCFMVVALLGVVTRENKEKIK